MTPDDYIQTVQRVVDKCSHLKNSDASIIASIVLVNECDKSSKCVVIATGTKSTPFDNIPKNGTILNDFHAEVLARRGFMKYLYDQLKEYDNPHSILERVDGHFKIKDGIKFHFVTSTSFCGDASIISQVEHLDTEDVIQPDEISVFGEFARTGAKNIEDQDSAIKMELLGDNGLPAREVQNIGVLRKKPGKGSPSFSMSCSDKMLRWCALGVQGVLLSVFIPVPIVFHSIIVSKCKRSYESFHRAIIQRLDQANERNTGTVLSMPQIKFATKYLGRNPPSAKQKSSFLTFVWISGSKAETKETIVRGYRQGFTRKCAGSAKRSCLSKSSFLESFLALENQWFPGLCGDRPSYENCKQVCLSRNPRLAAAESIFFQQFPKWLRTDRSKFYDFSPSRNLK